MFMIDGDPRVDVSFIQATKVKVEKSRGPCTRVWDGAGKKREAKVR